MYPKTTEPNRGRWRTTLVPLLLTVSAAAASEIPPHLAPGAELFEAAQYGEAQEFFNSAARDEAVAWIEYFLGRIHLQQGEIDEAIARLSVAVETDSESSLFVLWLGEAHVQKIDRVGMLKKLGVAKKARASFERAVELAPDDYEAREALVGYYLNAPAIAGGSREKALQQAVAMAKRDRVKGHLLMGRVHVEEEHWEVAAREYRAAIEAGDRSSRSFYWLGFTSQQLEDWDAAFEAFERAIQADGSDLSSYYQLGRTAIFSKSRLERAVECLTFYLDKPIQRGSPAAEHAHWRLGMVYELQAKDDLAAAEYRKALELDPDHEEAKKALAALALPST